MAASDIDAYLASLDAKPCATLQQLREDILACVPDAEQGLSYGVPAFRLAGKAVAGFSAAKKHLSYLPHSGQVLAGLDPQLLAPYAWSKGALRFAVDTPLPRPLVVALVRARRSELGL